MNTEIPDTALWKECARWLAKWNALPKDFLASQFDSKKFCLVLRDGFVLCKVVCKIDPLAIDLDEICSRTSDVSMYVGLRNIARFLRACRESFNIEEDDLFEPFMLYYFTDINKVVNTLSILSNTRKAARSGIEGFPLPDFNRLEFIDDYDYITLTPDVLDDDSLNDDSEAIYQTLVEGDCDDDIYNDLCLQTSDQSQVLTGVDQTRFCLKELIDTEWNYVQTLDCINNFFIIPLEGKLNSKEKKTIFLGIEDLLKIHGNFYSDLITAYSTKFNSIYEVFSTYKPKLTIYGEVCANLVAAQHAIRKLKAEKEDVAREIEACEQKVYENRASRVSLVDWITIPFQRILKYGLILRNIPKEELKEDEQSKLDEAINSMQDLALYINEVKRDHEMRQTIKAIQSSISGWNMTKDLSLSEYGRLIKDGEVNVLCPEEQGSPKLSYVFLFTRVLIVCKPTAIVEKMLGADQYVYKADFILDNFVLQDNTLITNQSLGKKYGWALIDRNKKIVMYVKSPKEKDKWIQAITQALNDLCPPESKKTNHLFLLQTFSSIMVDSCDACRLLLKGLIFQGYICKKCNLRCHQECMLRLKPCVSQFRPPPERATMPRPSVRVRQSLEGHPWYAGEITRTHAENWLRTAVSGTFLLRFNVSERSHAISLKTATGVKHMKVRTMFTGGRENFYLSEKYPFGSIRELVDFYRINNLRESFVGLDAYLKFPYKYSSCGDNLHHYFTRKQIYLHMRTIFCGSGYSVCTFSMELCRICNAI